MSEPSELDRKMMGTALAEEMAAVAVDPPLEFTKEEACQELLGSDHQFVSKEFAEAVAKAFGIEAMPECEKEIDTRWLFKGLTINRPTGYYDLHEFRAWVKENWRDWLERQVRNGETQTHFVDTFWMMYTQQPPNGYGLEGVPYAEGIDATDLACWCCHALGVKYDGYGGRGFQLRECVTKLQQHFGIEHGEF